MQYEVNFKMLAHLSKAKRETISHLHRWGKSKRVKEVGCTEKAVLITNKPAPEGWTSTKVEECQIKIRLVRAKELRLIRLVRAKEPWIRHLNSGKKY